MIWVSASGMYKLVFYLAIVDKILRHCHFWLARQQHVHFVLSSLFIIYHNGVASGSEITSCIKIDKPLVAYRFRVTLLVLNGVHNNVCIDTVNPVLSGHSKKNKKKKFKTNSRLMQVKSTAECSPAVVLNCIQLSHGFKAFVLSSFEWPLKTGFTVLPFLRQKWDLKVILFNVIWKIESSIYAPVLLNLLNEWKKRDKMRGFATLLINSIKHEHSCNPLFKHIVSIILKALIKCIWISTATLYRCRSFSWCCCCFCCCCCFYF